MLSKTLKTLTLLLATLFLSACGGGGGGGSSSPSSVGSINATFIDDIVTGIKYVNGSNSGFTDDNGIFPYNGGKVEFFIGNVKIGEINSISSDNKVFIQDIVGVSREETSNEKVLKIARFIQSIDSDPTTPEIEIPQETFQKFEDVTGSIEDLNLEEVLENNGFFAVEINKVNEHLQDALVVHGEVKIGLVEFDSVTLTNGAVEVSRKPEIEIKYSSVVEDKYITNSNIFIKDNYGNIIQSEFVDNSNRRVVKITPKENLAFNTSYVLVFRNKINLSGEDELEDTFSEINFTTLVQTDFTSPIISSSEVVSVNENQTSAYTIEASDNVGIVSYEIQGEDAQYFNVSNAGVVSFKIAPNYEEKSSYTIKVKVIDASDNSVSKDVIININDVNYYVGASLGEVVSVNEGNSFDITFSTDADVIEDVDISFEISGVNEQDYSLNYENNVKILAGQREAVLTVTLLEDDVYEVAESLTLRISQVQGEDSFVSENSSVTMQINESLAAPQISSVTSDTQVEGSLLVHNVTLDKNASTSLKYAYSFDYGTINSMDISPTVTFSDAVTFDEEDSSFIVVPAGVNEFTISIESYDNSDVEDNKTYSITLAQRVATGTIVSDDIAVLPNLSIESLTQQITIGENAQFKIKSDTILSKDLEIKYTYEYSSGGILPFVADAPVQYSITLPSGENEVVLNLQTLNDENSQNNSFNVDLVLNYDEENNSLYTLNEENSLASVQLNAITFGNNNSDLKLINANSEIINTISSDNIRKIVLSQDKSKAFVADGYDGLKIFNLSNPSNPQLIGSRNTSGFARGLALSSDETKIYVADGSDEVVVIDIQDPTSPFILQEYDLGGITLDVTLSSDNKLYVSNGYYGFVIIDLNSQNLKYKRYYTGYWVYSITLDESKNIAYLANGYGGVRIVDIENMNSVTEVERYDTDEKTYSVELSNDKTKAFLAVGEDGLIVLDVSNENEPSLLGSFNTTGTAYGVTLSSNEKIAYIADGSQGIVQLDINDFSNIKQTAKLDTAGSTYDIVIMQNKINALLADNKNGLVVANLSTMYEDSSVVDFSMKSKKLEIIEDRNLAISMQDDDLKIYDFLNNNTLYSLQDSLDENFDSVDFIVENNKIYFLSKTKIFVINIQSLDDISQVNFSTQYDDEYERYNTAFALANDTIFIALDNTYQILNKSTLNEIVNESLGSNYYIKQLKISNNGNLAYFIANNPESESSNDTFGILDISTPSDVSLENTFSLNYSINDFVINNDETMAVLKSSSRIHRLNINDGIGNHQTNSFECLEGMKKFNNEDKIFINDSCEGSYYYDIQTRTISSIDLVVEDDYSFTFSQDDKKIYMYANNSNEEQDNMIIEMLANNVVSLPKEILNSSIDFKIKTNLESDITINISTSRNDSISFSNTTVNLAYDDYSQEQTISLPFNIDQTNTAETKVTITATVTDSYSAPFVYEVLVNIY